MDLTKEQVKYLKKIHGANFKEIDIPTIKRKVKPENTGPQIFSSLESGEEEDEKRAMEAKVEEGRQENISPIPDPFGLK